jgi:D-alanyl-D-alanine carboxypeptidase
MRRMSVNFCRTMVGAAALGMVAFAAPSAHAQDRFSAIVIDMDTDEVLYADEADETRFPASLTKMMTIYLIFEALDRGEITLSTRMTVSRNASRQPASRLGVRRGETITVEEAITALAVRSANDVATVVAEHLGGTESNFAARMSNRAQDLGMANTRFANASGLPDDRHRTTARDMAILSEALIVNFPHYYHYFSTPDMTWRGRTGRNHNRLLGTVPGVDGLKTGYTRASRYNLSASAQRNGRRIVAVVLGGESSAARNAEMEFLLEMGFEELRRREIEAGGGELASARIAALPWRVESNWGDGGEDSDDQTASVMPAAFGDAALAGEEPAGFMPAVVAAPPVPASLPPIEAPGPIRR